MQFGVLPLVLGRMGQQHTMKLWLVMPAVIVSSALWMAWKMEVSGADGSFANVMTTLFCVLKILEYSLRGVLTEMVSFARFEKSGTLKETKLTLLPMLGVCIS